MPAKRAFTTERNRCSNAREIDVHVSPRSAVDVPLYFSRWRADELAGRVYLHWSEGLVDAAQRWIVVHEWGPWRPEAAWMALYFSVGVWTSIALSQAPAPAAVLNVERSSQAKSEPALGA